MMHNHDFERATSTFLDDVKTYVNPVTDPARAPRGMLIAAGMALALWGSAIIAVLVSR